MRWLFVAVLWIFGIISCLAAIQIVHDLKWPAESDRYQEAAGGAKAVRPYLNTDSVLNIQASALPDDFGLYLRYCLIPQRARLTPRPVPQSGLELLVGRKIQFDSLLAVRNANWPSRRVLLRYEDASTAYCLIEH